MTKVSFHTLGCKVNQYETEAMAELLLAHGYTLAAQDEPADLYVINTCTVTHVSDQKSRQQIRRMKRQNPEALIAVVGCYAQVAREAIEAIDEVDVIIGTKGRAKLPELVEAARKTGERQIDLANLEADQSFDSLVIESEQVMTRATVKIQEGCDMFCSYCIIPYARGHIASRPMDSILEEVGRLVRHGFQEIVLTGIHVASYGKEPGADHSKDLVSVIEEIARIPEVKRIRLSSIEPRFITRERLERMRATGKLCPHFHLSLQSGSDHILKKMNRKYDTALYREKAKLIRDVFPNAGMTTDVIVGFPEESEADAQQTIQFVEEIGFSQMHIFPYSKRQGTPAALFTGQVDPMIKKERARALAEVEVRLRHRFMEAQIGQEHQVLFEGNPAEGMMEGYTGNYVRVAAPYDPALLQTIQTVHIDGRDGDRMRGTIMHE